MLGVLLGGLFMFTLGGVLLILLLGARRIGNGRKERAREAQEIRAEAARIPRFFALTPSANPQIEQVDETLLWQLQEYLDVEQVLADEFVQQPTIESLYRESGRRLTGH
jgi:hypothetical protein